MRPHPTSTHPHAILTPPSRHPYAIRTQPRRILHSNLTPSARGLTELFVARDDPKFLTFCHAKVFAPGAAGLAELCRHLNVAYPPEARHALEDAISQFGRYVELFGTPKEAGGKLI